MLGVLFTHPIVIAVDVVTLGLLTWFWVGGWSITAKIASTLAILLYLGANHWRLLNWIERSGNSESAAPQLASGAYKQLFLLGTLIAGAPLFLIAGAWSVIERRKGSATRRSRLRSAGGLRRIIWFVVLGATGLMFVATLIAVVAATVISGEIPAAWLAVAIGMAILIALTTSLGIR